MSYEDVSEKFGYCLPTIGKILKEYNIKPYSKSRMFSPNLREDFFNTIDSEEKAYFLGLIVSDGCVYTKANKQGLVSITLQDCDRYILDRFKDVIQSNKNITHDGRGCSEIQIFSNQMIKDLGKYGVIDNKSLQTVFPQTLPKEMYPHFLRGVFDGDGSVSFYARPNKKAHVKAIRLCQGNQKFLEDVVSHLEKNVGIKSINTYQEKDSLWSIAYRNNESIMKLYHYLYDNAIIYMRRKKDLCDKVVNEIIYYHGNTEITENSKKFLVS